MKCFPLLLASVFCAKACIVVVNPFGNFGGGVPYFFSERFDGAGYQKVWTEGGSGTKDEDYATAPAPLEGTQSLRIAGAAQNPTTVTVFSADKGELWAFFKINITAYPSASRTIFTFRDSVAGIAGSATLGTTGTLTARNGSINSTASVSVMALSTTYNIWYHWKKGTGANGIAQAGFDTGTTEITSGNQFASTSSGNSTLDAHDLQMGFISNTTGDYIIDQVLVSDTATIGNNPQ